MSTAALPGLAPRTRGDADERLLLVLTLVSVLPLLVFVAWPVVSVALKSLTVTGGGLGLGNYAKAFGQTNFWNTVRNSFAVASTVTVVSVFLAFWLAYALNRANVRFKGLWQMLVMIPMFAPSLVQALGLVFLFGRNGIVNRTMGWDIQIYGFWGIVLADILYCLPQAFLVLSASFAVADSRPYEAARVLGASPRQIFFDVTLPSVKYGLISALFLIFTITMTDFGNPMVIGGDYTVLASEIYNQVSGQMNFDLGAVIAIMLLVPAALSFVVERYASRRQFALVAEQSVPLAPSRDPLFNGVMTAVAVLLCVPAALVLGIVVLGSFVQLWPYNFTFTLKHYLHNTSPGGYTPLWNSFLVALMSAGIGVVLVFVTAYVTHVRDGRFIRFIKTLAVLPAAIPGMVLGLSYVFIFNDPRNPLTFLYGGLLLLALCNVFHYYAQGFLTSSTRLKQISRSFDEASTCAGARLSQTITRITLPLVLPSVLAVAVFFFMRSMVSLSAVIFLVSPKASLASVSVMLLGDVGSASAAAAFSTCIVATVLASLGVLKLVQHVLARRQGATP